MRRGATERSSPPRAERKAARRKPGRGQNGRSAGGPAERTAGQAGRGTHPTRPKPNPADAWNPPPLRDTVAVVTGASRGAGRGIALVLGQAGATVYVTGRSTRAEGATGNRRETIDETAELVAARGGRAIPVGCDHTVDSDVEALFDRVRREQGRLDLLVNNAWGGYERAVDFSPFWQIPLVHWSLMFDAGVRSHLVAARCAVPLLLAQGRGLIVATTAAVGTQYRGNLFYDVAKTATNRMAVAMAEDLRPHGVAIVAFSPGWMRTEKVLDAFKTDAANWYAIAPLEKTESTEYVGRAVVTLAADPHVMQKTGRLLEVADLARQYGFADIDGRQVPPFRELFPELFEEQRRD